MRTTKEQGEKTRAQILDAIVVYMLAYGYPPTYKEIGERVNLKSMASVKYQLEKMKALKMIDFKPGEPRTIRVPYMRYERGQE